MRGLYLFNILSGFEETGRIAEIFEKAGILRGKERLRGLFLGGDVKKADSISAVG